MTQIQPYKKACVFGGTGFVGRHIVWALARAGYVVKVATRIPESAFFLRPAGAVGQVVPFPCVYDDPASIEAAVEGCDLVINCIGILYEKRSASFDKIHVVLPELIARSCAARKVSRFIHLSALGCENGGSRYAQSKKKGEDAVLRGNPSATILRPSVIFGAGDNFFNRFARMALISPALPLIGGGKTRFQPVYVEDVATAALAAANQDQTKGKIYELGGPETLNFREIYARLFAQIGRSRLLVPLPWWFAKLLGGVLSLAPAPLLTADQVESLKTDAVVAEGAEGFSALGLVPEGMDGILPGYLQRYRPGGRFGDKKKQAA